MAFYGIAHYFSSSESAASAPGRVGEPADVFARPKQDGAD